MHALTQDMKDSLVSILRARPTLPTDWGTHLRVHQIDDNLDRTMKLSDSARDAVTLVVGTRTRQTIAE